MPLIIGRTRRISFSGRNYKVNGFEIRILLHPGEKERGERREVKQIVQTRNLLTNSFSPYYKKNTQTVGFEYFKRSKNLYEDFF